MDLIFAFGISWLSCFSFFFLYSLLFPLMAHPIFACSIGIPFALLGGRAGKTQQLALELCIYLTIQNGRRWERGREVG